MQYSENFGLKEPEYGEKAKVDDLNFNTEKIDTVMGNNRSMIAEYFVQTQSYTAGKVVQLNGKTYRFKVDHAPGNFNPSEVDEEPLGNFIGEGGGSAEVTKEASGNPIEISDGASAPMVKCVSEITGSQDLHGYDKPWVGGAGKNKLPLVLADIKSLNTTGTWSGSSYTVNGVTFTVITDNYGNVTGIKVNGMATETIYFKLAQGLSFLGTFNGTYTATGAQNGGNDSTYAFQVYSDVGGVYINVYGAIDYSVKSDSTPTANIDSAYITIRSGYTASNLLFKPMIRLSTETDPTFAPYSNICPITAYTQGEIEVRGKNLFNKNASDIAVGFYLIASTGVLSPSQSGYNTSGYIPIEPNTYYTKSGASVAADEYCFFDSEKTFISGLSRTDTTVLSPNNAAYMRFDYKASETDNIQIEKGSTATDYEPYTSTTHTTTFPSAIYRGSEDCVSGEVVTEWGIVDIGTLTCSKSGNNFNASIPGIKRPSSTTVALNALCSAYEIIPQQYPKANAISGVNWMDGITFWGDGSYETVEDFKAAMSGVMLAYELATPTTSSVTPTNLPIKSLSGYNHIESSTGDMEVEYITEEYQPIVDLIESNSGKHVYSTDEQVVGTWIDGKTIYEKTYTNATEQSVSYQTWTPTVISATDIDRIVNLFTTRDADGGTYIPVVTRKENGYVEIFAAVGWIYNNITIQYTKTSSNNRSLSKSAPIEEDLSSEDEKSENTVTEEVNEK